MAHELIKSVYLTMMVHSVGESGSMGICDQLSCPPSVQHIGKLLIIWRKSEEKPNLPPKSQPPPQAASLDRAVRKEARASGQNLHCVDGYCVKA
jgi:hypothetical protein